MSIIYNNTKRFGSASLLGNYVYYKWGSYKQAGTRNIWKGGTEDSAPKSMLSNFDEAIFKNHEDELWAKVNKLKITNPSIKDLEDAYNDRLTTQSKTLNELAKSQDVNDVQRWQDVLQLVIDMVAKNNSAVSRTILMNNLQNFTWNSELNRPELKTVSIQSINQQVVEVTHSLPKITFETGSKVTRGQCKPRILYCDQLTAYISGYFGNSTVAKKDIDALKRLRAILVNCHTRFKAQQTKLKYLKSESEFSQYELTATMTKLANNILIKVRSHYGDLQQILTAFYAAWAEFAGNTLTLDITTIGIDEIKKAIQTGAIQTTKNITGKMAIDIDTSEAEKFLDELRAQLARERKQKDSTKVNKTQYTNTFLNFEALGGSVKNKRDIITTLNVNGQNVNLGISMKNTNLQQAVKESYSQDWARHPVALQDSALMLYLLGMQRGNENLGTHYLNILSTHPDADSTYQRMRLQANRALSLYILYSAITGEGQLRDTRNSKVNIFAIQDKATGKVKLFDIADLINRALKEDQIGFSLNPSIASINLDNSYQETQKARLTRVLMNARTKVIKARLSMDLLQNAAIK